MGTESSAEKMLRNVLESDAFSGVVAVRFEGRPVLEFAGGLANRETRQPNRLETRFATASVGKMFTAVCLARLVDAGLCRFEQPLVEIVPKLQPHFNETFTLEALLSHRSGLGDYIDDETELPFAGMDTARLDCPEAFLPHMLRAPRYAAGEYRYSSAGFILLGLAIEALTRLPFPAAIARWVTEPAGLKFTDYPRLDEAPPEMAIGYLPDGRPNVEHSPIIGGADGGIVTNVEDMQRFFRSLSDGTLLGNSTREYLWRHVSQITDTSGYGRGFVIIEACRRSWYGHTGSDPGVSARVAFAPESDSSIIVLCNQSNIAFRAFRLVLQRLSESMSFGAD